MSLKVRVGDKIIVLLLLNKERKKIPSTSKNKSEIARPEMKHIDNLGYDCCKLTSMGEKQRFGVSSSNPNTNTKEP